MDVTAENGGGKGEGKKRGILVDGGDGAEDAGGGMGGGLAVAEVAELRGLSINQVLGLTAQPESLAAAEPTSAATGELVTAVP